MIGIIGAGISGLSVATFLSRKGKQCVVLEKDSSWGGKSQPLIYNGMYLDMCSKIVMEPHPSLEELCRIVGFRLEYQKVSEMTMITPTMTGSRNEVMSPFMRNAIEEAMQYLKLIKEYGYSYSPGIRIPDNDLALSVQEFCEKHNLYYLLNIVFKHIMFAYGYGNASEIPIIYIAKLLSCLLTVSNPSWGTGIYKSLVSLLQKLASNVAVQYNTNVVNIFQGSNGKPVVVTDNGSQEYDYIIITSPLDTIDYDIITNEQKALFSKLKHIEMTGTACLLHKGQIKHPTIIGTFFGKESHIHGCIPDIVTMNSDDGHVVVMYQYGNHSHEQVLSDLECAGIRCKKIIDSRTWRHFSHVSIEDVCSGWYERVEKTQGTNRVYFANEALAFSVIDSCVQYAKHVVDTYF